MTDEQNMAIKDSVGNLFIVERIERGYSTDPFESVYIDVSIECEE